jgi:hypothetical protein
MPAPRRRLSDLLEDLRFLEVQLIVLSETGPAHRSRNRGQQIATLHRRLDALERRLRQYAGEEQQATISELRKRLLELERSYQGPERRESRGAQGRARGLG